VRQLAAVPEQELKSILQGTAPSTDEQRRILLKDAAYFVHYVVRYGEHDLQREVRASYAQFLSAGALRAHFGYPRPSPEAA
jgi:hypothetical protein